MTLDGKAALITGGKRMGSAVATALARAGADVALAYNRSRPEAEETAAAVRALGRRAAIVRADVSQPVECTRLVETAARELGRLDVLVNMASLYPSTPLEAIHVHDWDQQMAVDLRASFLCAQAAVPLMRAQGGGRIVNFSDWLVVSERPRYPGYLTYYVAKGGVKALTEALALELAADRILVNAIAPGPILAAPGLSAEESAAVVRSTPLGRWGGGEEIAKAVLFLVESDFVTGETFRVDGGRHVK